MSGPCHVLDLGRNSASESLGPILSFSRHIAFEYWQHSRYVLKLCLNHFNSCTQAVGTMADSEVVAAAFKSTDAGDAKEVARLLDEEPRLLYTTQGNYHRHTLLLHAVIRGRREVVRLLVERGADPHCWDGGDFTPLHYSASDGDEEVVALLLEAGADAAAQTDQADTPLNFASRQGHLGVVKLLLKHYAPEQVHLSDVEFQHPLWHACYQGHAQVVTALLLAGANHNLRDNGGQRPRAVAEERGHIACVRAIDVSHFCRGAPATPDNALTCHLSSYHDIRFYHVVVAALGRGRAGGPSCPAPRPLPLGASSQWRSGGGSCACFLGCPGCCEPCHASGRNC